MTKEKLEKLLITTATVFAGLTAGSLWLSNSESWKTYLPICLLCLTPEKSINSN